MSMCARAVALWLAACALAARAQAERVRPECKDPHCKWLRTDTFKITDYYLVDGNEISIYCVEKGRYIATCLSGGILTPNWPSFNSSTVFEDVTVTGCYPPPIASYAEVLQLLNVTITTQLEFWNIPTDSPDISLAGVPTTLEQLWMGTKDEGQLKLQPGYLVKLDGLHTLRIGSVFPDQMPPHLEYLVMWYTGIETLPVGALNVTDLRIREKTLTSINGSAPRLQTLMIKAPALKVLVLHDTPSKLLREQIVGSYTNLEVLELRRAQVDLLPANLLHDVTLLQNFTFTHGNITSLHRDFFSVSTQLQFIDLSYNELESLPRQIFSKLKELRELRLENNNLVAHFLNILAPLAEFSMLTKLDLSLNPLEELCETENASALLSLQQLQELSLALTLASRVCADWLRGLQALQHLDLSGNYVHSVSCEDFLGPRVSDTKVLVVDLTDNPLDSFSCPQVSMFRQIHFCLGNNKETKISCHRESL